MSRARNANRDLFRGRNAAYGEIAQLRRPRASRTSGKRRAAGAFTRATDTRPSLARKRVRAHVADGYACRGRGRITGTTEGSPAGHWSKSVLDRVTGDR